MASVVALTMILLVFGNMTYFLGASYQQASKYHAFKILMIDHDGGMVWQAMLEAYALLEQPTFPTFETKNVVEYSTSEDIFKSVQHHHYWAAIYSTPDASSRLRAALQGGTAAQEYNADDAFAYVWNEARYPSFAASVILNSIHQVVATARLTLNITSPPPLNDSSALRAYLNPLGTTSINILPASQASKNFINTILTPLSILPQFFFLMGLNAVSAQAYFLAHPSFKTVTFIRLIITLLYTACCAVMMAGYIWIFKEDMPIYGKEFALTWLLLWLAMHIYCLFFDAVLAVAPVPAVPAVVLTFIIMNVTSTVSPFEVVPGFYRWAWALPARNVYLMLLDIWAGGPNPTLVTSLPVLGTWWIVWGGLTVLALGKRWRAEVRKSDA
ncbi:uncharacterized protein BDZ99DRAFT_511773 [Mytilinidion resinicola]|uniref:DUF3533 domain-containing protein n=1 Tax=Mytilinidion resinicola TaxID=574789 RepID=A0A6A6Y7P9_9PEZI|nr:uncharacterized protein BDZ99DRAFT_511773 [Mytilinidion resinicola]KAF2804004.1 hypothetical protein BDZ99DRAFT_511773 [Mytilinidion resinicola]